MQSPEDVAREKIDKLLAECGWTIQNRSTINLFFAFHRPETLLEWLEPEHQLNTRPANFLTSDQMPTTNLWSAQIEAISNLEESLATNKRRALIQMATASKTYTAVNFVYSLIKLAKELRNIFFILKLTPGFSYFRFPLQVRYNNLHDC